MYQSFESKVSEALKAAGLELLSPTCPRSIRIINKLARKMDEPHLYPFVSSAEYAIRKSRAYMHANGNVSNLEYLYGLDDLMTRRVNAELG